MNNFSPHEKFWDEIAEFNVTEISEKIEFLKAENRSSTIFPVFKDSCTQTSIQFLSYWLKKHGNNVIARFTTRDILGREVSKWYEVITICKAFSYVISDSFPTTENGFCGSVEVEVFSKAKPLYTFPAVTVCYSNANSCSVVHSCIRTYNKGEIISDYALYFPQTGFDVDLGEENKNFICFFGGFAKTYKIEIELLEKDFARSYTVDLKNKCYGQSHIFYLEDIVPKQDIQLFSTPKCVIHHDLNDVFPRFYVGIRHRSFVPTLTHTFFDTSNVDGAHNEFDSSMLRAKNSVPNIYFDAAFSIPIYPICNYDTALRTYDQNLRFSGTAIVSLYSAEGDLMFTRSLTKHELGNLCDVGHLDLSKFVLDAAAEVDKSYSIRFAFVDEKSPFPKRFKLGLNVKRRETMYGSNICFAPLVSSGNTLSKPFNRRWFPIGGAQKYVGSIHNTSLNRLQNDELTECTLEFFNHQGDTVMRRIEVRDNASIFIDPHNDEKLSEFLGEKEGWCIVTSNTYLCDAYYFCMAEMQIGGDHAY